MNNNLERVLLGGLLSAYLFVVMPSLACAAELKVVDATGLVRSAKVVQDDGDVEVALGEESQSGTVCTLKNVDGLAPDKSVTATSSHTCVFSEVPAGTWQLSTSKSSKWQVRITGDR
jgi:hypothetical protein